MDDQMNGAESLVRTLVAAGVDTCFANPGTSEMHFVAALDRLPGMRCVLGLFEGVVSGAADGYARMADKPAAILLHCAPGLANGLANLHNARRANTPILNIVGDQATYHRPLDPPLTGDAEGWARGISIWTRTCTRADRVGIDAAAAVQATGEGAGGIATLILPSDVCWDAGGAPAAPLPELGPASPDPHAIAEAARLLRTGRPTVLLLSEKALRASGLEWAAKIAEATGARVFCPPASARIERGAGRHPITPLPYPVEPAVAALAEAAQIILVGATRPVAFFAYPGKPGTLESPDTILHVLARPEQDTVAALRALAEALGAGKTSPATTERQRPTVPTGAVIGAKVAQALTALMPEACIVVDESITQSRALFQGTAGAAPHDWLQLTGGAIGAGIPMATGAAIGAPGRRVINLQADGSALYTLQGLWTQARERLPVTTVILSNRKYAILLNELSNVGATTGKVAMDMLTLDNPGINFVDLARGFGVEAARADTMERFADLLATSLRQEGPFLIELILP